MLAAGAAGAACSRSGGLFGRSANMPRLRGPIRSHPKPPEAIRSYPKPLAASPAGREAGRLVQVLLPMLLLQLLAKKAHWQQRQQPLVVQPVRRGGCAPRRASKPRGRSSAAATAVAAATTTTTSTTAAAATTTVVFTESCSCVVRAIIKLQSRLLPASDFQPAASCQLAGRLVKPPERGHAKASPAQFLAASGPAKVAVAAAAATATATRVAPLAAWPASRSLLLLLLLLSAIDKSQTTRSFASQLELANKPSA